ncbi:MAG TPA: ABC transporter substrate-binding protein, partial [Bradyrhizobium sp.]
EELNPKRLSLLKEAVPSMRRVGVLLRRDFPNVATADHDWQVVEAAARQLELKLVRLDTGSTDEINAAFEQTSAKHVGGIMTFRNPTVVTYLRQITGLCQKYRLPAVFDSSEYAEAGGMLSYGPNINATYGQLARYVTKLMHGTPPGELPIEQPTKFELVINKRAADAIGVTVPIDLLTRADKVIQ